MNIKETIQIVLEQLELIAFIISIIFIATGFIYFHIFSKMKNLLSTLYRKLKTSFKKKLHKTKFWKNLYRIEKIKEKQASR